MGSHVRPDRGDHAGEVDAQLRLAREARVAAHRDEHVGKVQTRGGNGHLDLARPGGHPLKSGELEGLQIAGRANLQTHPVARMVDDGGVPLVGPQRARIQVGGVPLAGPECGLVLLRPEQQLLSDEFAVGLFVDVDLGRTQMRMLGTDDAEQTAQAGLFEVRPFSSDDGLRAASHDVEPRRIAGDVRQFPNNLHQVRDMLTAPDRQLFLGAPVARRGDHHDVAEGALGQVRGEPISIGGVIGVLRPRHRRHVRIAELERIGEFRRQEISGIRRADHQPGAGSDVRGQRGQRLLAPLHGL